MDEKEQQHLPVLAELERLDGADASVSGRPTWMRVRRLAIFAPCCKEEPLIEVMNTEPPCVLVRQVTYGHVHPEDTRRKSWSAARRGDIGVVWLSTFEKMAEQAGAKQLVPCRHERWWISAKDVVSRHGRHVLPPTDKRSRTL